MDIMESDEFWSITFDGNDFSGQELSGKTFESCQFISCNFSDAVLDKCSFDDCQFVHCNLSLTQLKYSKFSDVVFKASKLLGVDWTRVDWSSLVASAPVQFYESIVSDCSFYGLQMRDFILQQCVAHRADFREGDFSRADFSGTEFQQALFVQTNLTGADFTDAIEFDIDIFNNKLAKATFDRFEANRLLAALDIKLVG